MNSNIKYLPGYLQTHENGLLKKRTDQLYFLLESCELCARKCRVNRIEGELGYCKSGKELKISSYGPHFGEEQPLVGPKEGGLLMANIPGISKSGGSGTIFLTGCNLLCVFCQNYNISHLGEGHSISSEKLAEIMLHLQDSGCHNINFVTPTHFTPQILKSLQIAVASGLRLPIVWNCGGYENPEIITQLQGIVDIYMPDFKFGNSSPATKFCDAPDYFEQCSEAVKEMHRQVGDLKMTEEGIAIRGLLIRHLVMPNDLAGSEKILKFIASEISTYSYVNIMSQYRPQSEAYQYSGLNRCPTGEEYLQVIQLARKLGLSRGFQHKHLNRL